MPRGRTPEYKINQNIVDVQIRSGYRYGRCKICGKAVKAKNWHLHLHEQWTQREGQLLNRACLDEIESTCSQIIDKEGENFLETTFPEGISGENKKIYMHYVFQQFARSLSTYPILNSSNPVGQSQIIAQDSQEQAGIFSKRTKNDQKIIDEEAGEMNNSNLFQIQKVHEQSQKIYKSKAQRQADQAHLDIMFAKSQYNINSQGVKLNQLILSYKKGIEKPSVLAKELSPQRASDHSLLFLLKQCFVCRCSFRQTNSIFRECIHCRTRIHPNCFKNIQQCLCSNINMTPRANTQEQFRQIYGEPKGVIQQKILSNQYQGIKDFSTITTRKKIEQAEREIIRQISKMGLHYVISALAPKDSFSQTNALGDPFIVRATKQLIQVYERYKNGEYKAPVEIMKVGQIGWGIKTMEDIPSLTLISEYACDILPMTTIQYLILKQHTMFYANGKNSEQELVLAPFNCSNWAPLINHDSQGNCSSLRIVINKQIRVLLYSRQKIKKGEQLLYNYNSQLNQYPTQNFLSLKI